MRIRTTVTLLTFAVLLAALIYFFEREPADGVGVTEGVGTSVLAIRSDDITGLSYHHQGGKRVECIRQDGAWLLQYPLRAPITPGAIEKLLSHIETLRRAEVVSSEQRVSRGLSLDDYGLGSPRLRIVLMDELGTHELLVGDDSPLGTQVYVKLGGAPEVIATSQGLLELLPEDPLAFRDRRLFQGAPAKIVRVEIHSKDRGFLRLVKRDNAWRLLQPFDAPADTRKVVELIRSLYEMEAVNFVWDPPIAGVGGESVETALVAGDGSTRAEAHGLGVDEAAYRVEIWSDDDQLGRELIISSEQTPESGLVYAKRRNLASIYSVRAKNVACLSVSADDLRARELFPVPAAAIGRLRLLRGEQPLELVHDREVGWQLVEPVHWKADEDIVRRLIDALLGLKAEAFLSNPDPDRIRQILEHPALTIELGGLTMPTNAPAAKAGDSSIWPGPLYISTYPAVTGSTVEAVFPGGNVIFGLGVSALDAIPANPLSAAALRDRTILRINAADVKSLTLRRGTNEQSVALSGDGAWVSVSGTNEVNVAVVEEILGALNPLRALRVEVVQPEGFAPYGLDQADMVLTLGLLGEQGIRKSLLIGFRSRTDGAYALVQGQDTVFVVATQLVELLTRAILYDRREF